MRITLEKQSTLMQEYISEDEELIDAIKTIRRITGDWYPNEYKYITEELFNSLLILDKRLANKISDK